MEKQPPDVNIHLAPKALQTWKGTGDCARGPQDRVELGRCAKRGTERWPVAARARIAYMTHVTLLDLGA